MMIDSHLLCQHNLRKIFEATLASIYCASTKKINVPPNLNPRIRVTQLFSKNDIIVERSKSETGSEK